MSRLGLFLPPDAFATVHDNPRCLFSHEHVPSILPRVETHFQLKYIKNGYSSTPNLRKLLPSLLLWLAILFFLGEMGVVSQKKIKIGSTLWLLGIGGGEEEAINQTQASTHGLFQPSQINCESFPLFLHPSVMPVLTCSSPCIILFLPNA